MNQQELEAISSSRKFKGTPSEYSSLHYWVRKQLGKPTICESCGTKEGRLEWSNKSQKYLKELTDWQMLCTSCHAVYDRRVEYCKHGHKMEGDNIHPAPRTREFRCVQCRRDNSRKWAAAHREEIIIKNAKRYTKHVKPEVIQLLKNHGGSDV